MCGRTLSPNKSTKKVLQSLVCLAYSIAQQYCNCIDCPLECELSALLSLSGVDVKIEKKLGRERERERERD